MARVGPFTIGGAIFSQRKRERILRNDRERMGGGTEGPERMHHVPPFLMPPLVPGPGPAPGPAQFQFDGITQTTTPAPLRCHLLLAISQGITSVLSLQVMSPFTLTFSLVPTRPYSSRERNDAQRLPAASSPHAPRYNCWKVVS